MSEIQYNLDERYEFSSTTKKHLGALLILGIIATAIGLVLAMNSGHGEGDGHALNAATE
ncbi:MAG: hypothetical protein HKN67_14000, partial [Saprospiraceae bacterium]|nr:hypothetical protein [Saprospiraceae bacterium]